MSIVDALVTDDREAFVPIVALLPQDFALWRDEQSASVQQWLTHNHFSGEDKHVLMVPDETGQIDFIVAVVDPGQSVWALAHVPALLPPGDYILDDVTDSLDSQHMALGWALAQYYFGYYQQNAAPSYRHLWVSKTDLAVLAPMLTAISLVRDLINTPANDLGPAQLTQSVKDLASNFGGTCQEWVGEQLLQDNFPAIYAVGKASEQAPRLVELTWGDPKHPRVSLVGKGVCFDSGGLNIKPANGMVLMKKDMGGAAHALGLAYLIMAHQLPVRLQLLIPAVENAIAGNAYRPGDVLATRKGVSVEVGDTDAEGRLILSDALTKACENKPSVLIDFATLTGAARVAVGTEVAPCFATDLDAAWKIQEQSATCYDPVWPMPLYAPYRDLLNSKIADIRNISSSPYGGAITAALFLQAFVDVPRWFHFDVMAWNTRALPGRPEGGEAIGLRAVWHYVQSEFAQPKPRRRRKAE